MTESSYVQAFDLMWEMFDEPALLIHRNRTIVAANRAARRLGGREGEKFRGLAPSGKLPGYQWARADEALRNRRPISDITLEFGAPVTCYWIPLPESPDLYVHFGLGVARQSALRDSPLMVAANDQENCHVS